MTRPPRTGLRLEGEEFVKEMVRELGQHERLLERAKGEAGKQYGRIWISIAVLVCMAAIIVVYPDTLLIWLIVALLLYSYNFLILFLPTTAIRWRPREVKRADSQVGWETVRSLLRKKRLAVEIGLTMFLGGMVPLTLSFTIILGLGLLLLGYFHLTAQSIEDGLTSLVMVQVAMIVFFYALMNLLRPQAQGITIFAKAWKNRIGIARSNGWVATTVVMIAVLGLVTGAAVLFVGALILPGVTLASLFSYLGNLELVELLIIIAMVASQIWVMRSFQSYMSRRMAISLLEVRISRIRELLTRSELILGTPGPDEVFEFVMQEVRSDFYSMAIYDIIRLDFFGHAPVYLVGPRVKYVLDLKILAQVPG